MSIIGSIEKRTKTRLRGHINSYGKGKASEVIGKRKKLL